MQSNQPFPWPEDEARRLEVLRECALLDTEPEQEYDDLLRLAADICGVPIAAITLVDEARQWFKARIGIDACETSRDLSFCAHTICQPDGELLVVSDASRDRRFASYANVRGDPRIRFYAGAPLVTHDGAALGSLCVVDRVPRELTSRQETALRVLSRQVINTLELRRMVHQQQALIATMERTRSELEEARNKAERTTAAKGQFIAGISHEIRTPLNAIIGMSTLLGDENLSEQARDCAATVRSSAEILLALVNDVLDLSKIESGRLELEHAPFDLPAAIQQARDCLTGAARGKGLVLEVRTDPALPRHVCGDVTRFQQILINLMANAIKFTAKGRVTVEIGLAPESQGEQIVLACAVADTGIGIPAARLNSLFQDYTQADPSITRRYGGTGLGLSISKRLAEMHGGRIWVESQEGSGSTFHFTLAVRPAKAAARSPAAAADPEFATRHPLRILVADDNPVNRKVAARLLGRLGYTVEQAADGREALQHLREDTFDLVLMDLEMPTMDGLATTERIRAEFARGQQPWIAALTAHVLASDRQRFLDTGMDDYLAKPIRPDLLREVLERAVAHITQRGG